MGDSLQVGEEMAKEQGELLAGKYKNAEDLEQAYIELQKKLGDKEEPEATKEEEVTDTEEETPEHSETYAVLEKASKEYYENGEKLSPQTLEEIKSFSSQDLISAYIEYQKNNPSATSSEEADVTTAEINKIQNSVGGETKYNNLVNWASQNLKPEEIRAFDDVVGTGNAAAIQLGVDALQSK